MVVTPSTYGTDNACTLDALGQLGDCARGVAVVDAGVSAEELSRLAARRVRGLRVNFVSPQSWGATTPEMLATLARKVADIEATGATVVAAGNPGCLMQIASGLESRDLPVHAVHTVTLLAEAYRRARP